ncbi:MAG: hypothetical protein ACNA78_01780 [Balneolaceae bacterium]
MLRQTISLSFLLILTVLLFSACTEEELAPEYRGGEQAHAVGDTLQVTGSLIDSHCYALDPDNTGHDHQLPQSGFREDCAEYCALQGYPVAVLNKDDEGHDVVWTLMTASQIFADYMTQQVRVQGTFRSNGVLDPLRVELSDGEDGWIRIM